MGRVGGLLVRLSMVAAARGPGKLFTQEEEDASAKSCRYRVPGNWREGVVSAVEVEQALLYGNSTYDASVRPSVAALGRLDATPEKVEIQVEIFAYKVSESSQSLQIHGLMRVSHYDDRLRFGAPMGCVGPGAGDGSWVLASGTDAIWRPALYFDNAASSEEVYYEYLRDSRHGGGTWVYGNGNVWLEYELHHALRCAYDVAAMPYDETTCEIHVTSWVYPGSAVDLGFYDDVGVVTTHVKNPAEWTLRSATWTTREVEFFGEPWSQAVLRLRLRRRSWYYVIEVFCPVIMFLLITYAGFFIVRDSVRHRECFFARFSPGNVQISDPVVFGRSEIPRRRASRRPSCPS